MATRTYYFSGIAKWTKVRVPDEKYGNYTMSFYADKDTRKAMKEAGIGLGFNEDDEGMYCTLRRKATSVIKDKTIEWGPPKVFDAEGNEYEGYIGNGSTVTVKIDVYDTREGKGTRWQAVRVDELVEYNPPEQEAPVGLVGVPF